MLFFRSEERVAEWCRTEGCPVRPTVPMDRLWILAETWYGTRLSPDSRRPQPDEIRAIFERAGLEGDFWDPWSDTFG